MADDPRDADRINDAFASFTDGLRELLTAEARRSVDGAIERLTQTAGPFRLDGVEVEVVIRNMHISAVEAEEREAAKPAPRRAAPAKATAPRRPGGRGRPAGELRQAILEEFEHDPAEHDLAAIRDRLAARRVQTTDDNLHQQLRRLVTAGRLERVARGVYRRAEPTSA
jgi:hypothetical protein